MLSSTILNRYVDYCCSFIVQYYRFCSCTFGAALPFLVTGYPLHITHCTLPIAHYPLHITHCLFLTCLMLVTSRCRGVRMGPNTLHSRIKERKLPLNSRHESFEEERDLPIFPGLAVYRNFRPITRG